MRNIILILCFIFLSILSLTSGYTAPTYDSVNFTLCYGYTAPTYDSVNFTLGLDESCGDSCNPSSPLTSDYTFDCSENCIQSTELDAATYDIILSGSGTFTLTDDIIFKGTGQQIFVESGCEIRIESGGGFR